MHNARRHARGITLIEMIIALAVASILATAAAPAFGNLIQKSRAQAARSALVTALNTARMTAVTKLSHVVVCPSRDQQYCDHSTEWQDGWIVFLDADHDGRRTEDEALVTVAGAEPDGVTILSTAGRTHVTYRMDGTSGGSNVTFTVCDRRGADDAGAIVINNAGRVRSGVPTAAAASACAATLR